MNTRLKHLRSTLKISQIEFSSVIGISQGYLSDVERGIYSLSEPILIAICSKFNVNEDWLKNGEGEMFNTFDIKYIELFDIYSKLSPPLQNFILNTALELLKIQNEI